MIRMPYPHDVGNKSIYEDANFPLVLGACSIISAMVSCILLPLALYVSLFFLTVYAVPVGVVLASIPFYMDSFKTNESSAYAVAVRKYRLIKDPVAREKAQPLMLSIYTHDKSHQALELRHDKYCKNCEQRLKLLEKLREYDRPVELDNSDLEEVNSFLHAKKELA